MTVDAYNILTGVGTLYIAPVGETMPDVDATPAGNWRSLGETQDGVEVEFSESLEKIRTDQRTGAVKTTRTEEDMMVKTKLAEATLENLGDALGVTLTDTAAGVGTIGTREIPLHRGATVSEWAVLFRGSSPYYNGNAQYEVPRAIFEKIDAFKYEKGPNTGFPITISALEDLNAATEAERFGKLIGQDAAALT